MLVCCCSLAGTAACRSCPAYIREFGPPPPQYSDTRYIPPPQTPWPPTPLTPWTPPIPIEVPSTFPEVPSGEL